MFKMSMELVQEKSSEDAELSRKEIELAHLKDTLADCQLKLTVLNGEITAFESRYRQTIGTLYAELDEIKAKIAEVQAALNPTDQEAYNKATTYRAVAEETAREANNSFKSPQKNKIQPTDNLKKLYRDAARRIHPDLAADDSEREHRHEVMTQVNIAYEDGDEDGLRDILEKWIEQESSQTEDLTARIERVKRNILQVEESIQKTKAAIRELQTSDIGLLLAKSKAAEWRGRNFLQEMAVNVTAKIVKERSVLTSLLDEVG